MDELDEIIAELDTKDFGKLPEGALREAQRRREEITPRLIELIRRATAEAGRGEAVERNGHFFALFLLTEFGAREALPAILDAVSLQGDGPRELFGDAVTECLSRVLAALAVDSPEVVDRLLADRSLNQYVRWGAAGTYLYWVRDGRMTRENAVQRLREHLVDATANRDVQATSAIVTELADYAPREAVEDIDEAFRRGLIDELLIHWSDVQRSVAEGTAGFDAHLASCPPTGIEDTVDELRKWAVFHQPDEPRAPRPQPATASERPRDDRPRAGGSSVTVRHTGPRPRRNEPCPCGSGKKYKQCCGRK